MDDQSTGDFEGEIGGATPTRERFVENDLLNSLLHLKYTIAVLCVFGVTAALLIQIVSRLVNMSVPGMQALAQLLAVWMAFLVVANLEFEDKHIKVDYFVDRLPTTVRDIVDVVILLISTFFAAVIFLAAVMGSLASAGTTIPTLGIPTPALHAAPLLGMFLLTLAYLVKLKGAISIVRGTEEESRA